MVNWECKNCKKETDHQVKETEIDRYKNYKFLICQECGMEEMVPVKVLKNNGQVNYNSAAKENKVASDGGFDREVDPSCESGICGAR